MNPIQSNTRHLVRSRRTRFAAAAIVVLSLTAAACGDDESDSSPTDAAAATEMPAGTDAPMTAESMDDAPMTTEPMTSDMDEMDDMDAMALEPSGPACSAVPMDGEGSFGGMADDPAATAAGNNPVLSTLVTAVGAAGLVDTLNGAGPFTIFAPTNDAFAAIPPADLEAVLADVDLLTSILTYHVVAGESLSSADLVERGTVATVNGGELTIEAGADGGLLVNGVATGCIDVPTANATVHIIGGVLMP